MLYPINLKLEDIEVTIIGGGEVAYRKCKNFIDFGQKVRVISNKFIDKFYKLGQGVDLVEDSYDEEYITSSFIVIAATNNRDVNKEIGIYCRNSGKLVNVVDDIDLSNFTMPSYIKRGDLVISISTGGKSPSLSSKIRKELEEQYDDSYEEYVNLLGKVRKDIIRKYKEVSQRRTILNGLVNLTLEELKEVSREYEK